MCSPLNPTEKPMERLTGRQCKLTGPAEKRKCVAIERSLKSACLDLRMRFQLPLTKYVQMYVHKNKHINTKTSFSTNVDACKIQRTV